MAENLILTAAHVLWNKQTGTSPELEGWQVRLARDYIPGASPSWPFRRDNHVIWHDKDRDLALIQLVDPKDGPLRPLLQLRVATVEGNNPHAVEAQGYPRASKEKGQDYRDLTPALGRLTAADRHRPLRFGVDSCDLPNEPHMGWPGMSGSAVLLQHWPNPNTIWVYGVVQEVPASFDGQLRVTRLADAWQQNAEFRKRLVAAGVADEEAEDPTGAVFLFSDQASPPRPFADVPARTLSFTGRKAELDRLDAILLGDRPAAVTQVAGSPAAQIGRAALQGLGGVGKTSLAVEYTHRYRSFYTGVWWCAAETRIGLLTSLARLAVELGAAATDEANVERAAKAGLRRLAERHATFLLVYDNVASPDVIADLLPASGARVLVTSRFADWGDWAEEVALDVLPQAEAVAFLMIRTAHQDKAGATLLADALGWLPLALDHAATYCRRTQTRFADYAAKAESLIAAAPRGVIYPRSVAATFRLALAEAIEFCPMAEALMAYVGQCGPERIPLALVEGAIADETERVAALLALTEVSLIRHDPFEDGTPAVSVHRLVQAVARAQAEAKGGAASAAEWVTRRLLEIYPGDGYRNPASWPFCAQLIPHVLALHEAKTADRVESVARAELLVRSARYLHVRAAYLRAEGLIRDALIIYEQALGPEHPDTAASLDHLAVLLQERGDLAAARPLHERALAICDKVLGPEHLDTARCLNHLARLYKTQGSLPTAWLLYRRVQVICERVLGPEHPDTATSLNNLASTLQAQGDLAAARPLYERALAISEKVLGPEHPDTARALNNLASLFKAQGDFAAARPPYERAMAICEKVLGPKHPITARTLNNLANLLQAQGDLVAARLLYMRALTIYVHTLGPNHPDTVIVRDNIARLDKR